MIVTLAACHQSSGSTVRTPERLTSDSLEGIVRVVGVQAFPEVTLARDDGLTAVTLEGPFTLSRVAGLRVAVAGTRVGTRFTVNRFVVVAANGVPAHDGILTLDGDALVLVTAAGTRLPVANPPPALRGALGHRVWISGRLEQAAVAFGVID
jgi:hypothetical protein